jgi:peptide deformylase
MTIREIYTLEHPVLRQKAKKVHRFDPSLKTLASDMFETMHAADGAGLAGPQIAQGIRIFVAELENRKVAVINPEIIERSGETIENEGCLSIPGYIGRNIRRAQHIVVKGQNVNGKPVRFEAEDWFARVCQHEIDHLDGILYLDRLDRPDDLEKVQESEEVSMKSR